MNTEQEMESMLRSAPEIKAPAHLKQDLIENIRLPGRRAAAPAALSPRHWLARWWPAIGAGAASAACAVVLGVQQMEIKELRRNIEWLAPLKTNQVQAPAPEQATALPAAEFPPSEIQRLREKVTQLEGQIAGLENVEAENQRLRAQLAAPLPGFSPDEIRMLADAKERAQAIQCVNQLKQIGLAVRLWAIDHEDVNPPNLGLLSKELQVTKLLVCPGDSSRSPAADWSTFTAANISYDYLTAGAPIGEEPSLVMCRCHVHGNILLNDGSVQSAVAKNNPSSLVQRNGKLYYEHQALPR